jgi:hypothetical protein
MEKKQTAVEFYRTELSALVSMKESTFQTENEIFEQAKQMEREQIVNAVDGFPLYTRDLLGNDYYNELYGEKFGEKFGDQDEN